MGRDVLAMKALWEEALSLDDHLYLSFLDRFETEVRGRALPEPDHLRVAGSGPSRLRAFPKWLLKKIPKPTLAAHYARKAQEGAGEEKAAS